MSSEPDRLSAPGAWSSALSTTEFAACVSGGMTPLGFVQGCSVVSWNFGGFGPQLAGGFGGFGGFAPGGYVEQFSCPHGFVAGDHRLYGANYEKPWVEQSFDTAFVNASSRLLDEARRLGAHGVIGVVERTVRHGEIAALEISLSGTAVGVEGVAAPEVPFATFLAGQKLNKLLDAGYVPIAIAQSIVVVGIYESCITEAQVRGAVGGWASPSGEIDQISRAENAARRLARERVRDQLGGDTLHGAELLAGEYGSAQGAQIEVRLRGNRVRRFAAFPETPPPRPVVNLVDR